MTQTSLVHEPFPVLAFALSGLTLLRQLPWFAAAVLVGALGLLPGAAFIAFAVAPQMTGTDGRPQLGAMLAAFAAFAIGGFVWVVLSMGFQVRVFRKILGLTWRANLWVDGWRQLVALRASRFYSMGPAFVALVVFVALNFVSRDLDEPWRRIAPVAGGVFFVAAIVYSSVRRSLVGVVAYAGPRNLDTMGAVTSRGWALTRGYVMPLALMLSVSWLVSLILLFIPAALVGAGLWAAGAPEVIATRVPALAHVIPVIRAR